MEFGLDIYTRTRVRPSREQQAICQCCEEKLIAKCGDFRVHHWAHKNSHCDNWWEPETEWHRNWKSKFPAEWRESIKYDTISNEKHIADIYNPYKDLVIEFQNSPISPDELRSRESFYNKLIWVVNVENAVIKTTSIQSISEKANTMLEEILNETMNDFIKIPSEIVTLLNIEKDKILSKMKESFFKQELEELKNYFDLQFDLVAQKIQNGKTIHIVGEAPTKVQENLFRPIINKAIEYLDNFIIKNESLDQNNQYLNYEWKRRKKVWNYSQKPVFLDTGEELLWLQSNTILKKIPYSEFTTKYCPNR
jgi:competence CoiA-like predicted nuclease